jgi:hypothetical protein
MPDVDLATGEGTLTVYSLLHEARPLLLNLGAPGVFDNVQRPEMVKLVDAQYGGPWELPVLGGVPAPLAVLVRPDGYVAWVGEGTEAGLSEAMATWCGSALV